MHWQLKWSKSLISHPGGRDSLYQLIYHGDAWLRILTDSVIYQSLYSHVSAEEQGVLARLLGTIQDVDSPDRVIQQTYSQLKSRKGYRDEGRNLFIHHCASCHQKAGQGELVGPQLDGIRSRGLQRLIADIYFPNENVDQAFALHQIETTDTQIHTGLALRTDGLMKYFRDPSGRIFSLNSREIVSETILPQSPMPGNFSETLSLEQLSHLTTFLLAD
jgi:putative heme-binding domain-containing protein